MDDVLFANFDDLSRARAAMEELTRSHDERTVTIRAAAVVVREQNGRFWIPDGESHMSFTGTVAGGAVGALLGALSGPVGVLLLGATGAVLGSVADTKESDLHEGILAGISRSVPPGTTAVVADVDEPDSHLVARALEASGGRVSRRRLDEIEAELAAAEGSVGGSRAGNGPRGRQPRTPWRPAR